MSAKPTLTIVLGPTASGKTNYAIALAKQHGGAVVSADSRQVYAGMDIGTAKVEIQSTKHEIRNAKHEIQNTLHDVLEPDMVHDIPHYLLNIREPNDPITLPDWQKAAYEVIDKILSEGERPILAGGTMLYIDSIIFNYSIPNVAPNPALRQQLEAQPTDKLYEQLLSSDPDARTHIEFHHKQRIIRALEVIHATGKPFSALRKKQAPRYTLDVIGLNPDWDTLTQRITTRCEQMLESGLLEETAQLREQYGKELPLLQTMNYGQAGLLLDGELDKKKALTEMVRANLRYARRQMSWWRGRNDIRWITPSV